MDLGIRGKRALVCASSRGLGRGCAEALAEAGVDLVLNARGVETLEATADHIRQRFPIRVTPVPGDITTEAGRAAVLAEGPFDILVTNAGGPPPGMWSDWRREDFIRALDANMLTPIALMQAVLPGMMERGWGRIINISSVNAIKGQFGQTNYSAAKAGMAGFSKALAQEVVRKGVTVNTVSPGYVETDMVMAIRPEVRQRIVDSIPMGRLAKPEEIAAVVAFLASEEAGYITGANISVNGGMHMM